VYEQRATMEKKVVVRVSRELHEQALEKAKRELRPLSAIIRKLMERWLKGEISLEDKEH
jgi:predicted HicB family RNase H-like nuclease